MKVLAKVQTLKTNYFFHVIKNLTSCCDRSAFEEVKELSHRVLGLDNPQSSSDFRNKQHCIGLPAKTKKNKLLQGLMSKAI